MAYGNMNDSGAQWIASDSSRALKIMRDFSPPDRYNTWRGYPVSMEGFTVNKLHELSERFVRRYPDFGLPGLMRYIVIAQAVVYALTVFSNATAVSFLAFRWSAILHGEIWRLFTFIFMPGYSSLSDLIWLFFFLYLYYMIGSTLEREWGTAKFNLYYLSGVVLTVLVGVLSALISGQDVQIMGTNYVNLSMFFAFAMLYPDTQFLIFLIIPVKVKWLAWLDAAFFGLSALSSALRLDLAGALLPLIAILNFFAFFWPDITDWFIYRRQRAKHQTSAKTIRFRAAAREHQRKEARQGYRHKCEICGRTDADFPDLQFRYCSRCAGYHCFCQDHIFSHEHFK